MKCDNYMHDLISAWLDGELDRGEAEKVEKHLGECAACREHLAILREIQTELRACAMEMSAPEGLSAAVMARIAEPEAGLPRSARNDNNEGSTRFAAGNDGKGGLWRWRSIAASWKRGIAAAAATILVAGASYAMVTQANLVARVQMADNNKVQLEEINSDNNGTKVAANNHGDNLGQTPEGNNGATGGTDNNKGNSDTPNNQGENDVKNTPSETTVNNTPQTPKPPADIRQTPEMVALLSIDKERIIRSTLIKARVEEPDTARERVNSLAEKYKASIRQTGSQNTAEGSLTGYEMTIDRDKAGNLVNDLKTVGTVINKDESSKNIGDQYNKQVEQYQSLLAQLKSSDDAAKQEELSSKMNAIEQQLKTWESDTGKQTIVIWLEN